MAKYKIYFQYLIANQEASSLWVSLMKQTRIADATNIYYLIIKSLIMFTCDWCLFSEYVVIVLVSERGSEYYDCCLVLSLLLCLIALHL